jgi:hypothetical protein
MSEINEALLEGISANDWTPGSWATVSNPDDDEWQPDIEPPHINDYAAFKKHKHYGKYFRPYRYQPFPAWIYHKTLEPRLVKSKEEVLALGPEWSPIPNKTRVDMTGKSSPVKSETQRLAEVVSQAVATRQGTGSQIDATAIASIVAAVLAATQGAPKEATSTSQDDVIIASDPAADVERDALLELAEKEGVKVDKRWGNDRIKKELGL